MQTHVQITISLLKSEDPNPRLQIGGGQRPVLPNNLRYDSISHDVTPTTQGRCIMCSGNTRSKCQKCDVRLHYSHNKECFKQYHTKY